MQEGSCVWCEVGEKALRGDGEGEREREDTKQLELRGGTS